VGVPKTKLLTTMAVACWLVTGAIPLRAQAQVVAGPPLLVPAATDAVKKWMYKPMLPNGAPVEVVPTVDITFSLSE
jgi:hypothetical protein